MPAEAIVPRACCGAHLNERAHAVPDYSKNHARPPALPPATGFCTLDFAVCGAVSGRERNEVGSEYRPGTLLPAKSVQAFGGPPFVDCTSNRIPPIAPAPCRAHSSRHDPDVLPAAWANPSLFQPPAHTSGLAIGNFRTVSIGASNLWSRLPRRMHSPWEKPVDSGGKEMVEKGR